jgi:BirA family biotin operon repressor/biotin-[acetyl-CoA-carboxylase] ligase
MSLQSDTLPPELASALAQAELRLGRFGSSIVYLPSTASTNDVAAKLAEAGRGEGTVVVADAQTAGRGRRGRTWFSPPLSGLYVSVLLDPARAAGETNNEASTRAKALLTLTAGVALAEAIQTATGLGPDIKWPNDLLIGSRKAAGILAEAVTADIVVLGYGINVGRMSYPPELADRATSLETELGRQIDRASLFVETLAALARRYDDLVAGGFDAILDAWRGRAPGSRGRRVRWDTPAGAQSGVTAGIDDRGALLVTVGDRVERLVAGEVTWL